MTAVENTEVEVERVPTIYEVEPESINDAIRIVVRGAVEANGLVLGLSEVARTLDRKSAHMCILADDCEDEEYKKLIRALCYQSKINCVQVDSRSELATWAGLIRRDPAGEVKKVLNCSCVAIRDFGERSKALEMVLREIAKQ